MGKPIKDTIKKSIEASEELYHRLVLLVGEVGSGKTSALRELADELGADVININLKISEQMLELTAKQRALRLPKILAEIAEKGKEPILLDNLEILFDKDLQQDPLRLLQSVSRNRCVVATWNGRSNNKKLFYAQAGHPEYRSYEMVDALIVDINKATSNQVKREVG